jgi:hypothetical protein
MNKERPYVLVCKPDSFHLVGPFDTFSDAASWGVRTQDIRTHVVTLTPDDAHAPVSVLQPSHAAAIMRHEAAIAAERKRERVV